MELRRAILLFAVVLGVAAVVSSIARPPERGGDDSASGDAGGTGSRPAKATSSSGPVARSPQPTTIEFPTAPEPQTRRLEVGRPATVLVEVETPAQIDIPTLGLTDAAEPLTPALFEVLATAAGRHPIMARPAASEALPSRVGTLVVAAARLPKRSDRTFGATPHGR